jgi:GNAT superfamily N-acetyltransferase
MEEIMEWKKGPYRISTDNNELDKQVIYDFLNGSYWAASRPKEVIVLSIKNSLCFVLYHETGQVGFARVVTDYATFFWLCDVFVLEKARGKGLGKWLMECVLEYPPLTTLRGLLATQDAHGLYEKYGFMVLDDPRRIMVKPRLS